MGPVLRGWELYLFFGACLRLNFTPPPSHFFQRGIFSFLFKCFFLKKNKTPASKTKIFFSVATPLKKQGPNGGGGKKKQNFIH